MPIVGTVFGSVKELPRQFSFGSTSGVAVRVTSTKISRGKPSFTDIECSGYGMVADEIRDLSVGDKVFIGGEIHEQWYQKDGGWKSSLKMDAKTIEVVRKTSDKNDEREQEFYGETPIGKPTEVKTLFEYDNSNNHSYASEEDVPF